MGETGKEHTATDVASLRRAIQAYVEYRVARRTIAFGSGACFCVWALITPLGVWVLTTAQSGADVLLGTVLALTGISLLTAGAWALIAPGPIPVVIAETAWVLMAGGVAVFVVVEVVTGKMGLEGLGGVSFLAWSIYVVRIVGKVFRERASVLQKPLPESSRETGSLVRRLVKQREGDGAGRFGFVICDWYCPLAILRGMLVDGAALLVHRMGLDVLVLTPEEFDVELSGKKARKGCNRVTVRIHTTSYAGFARLSSVERMAAWRARHAGEDSTQAAGSRNLLPV